MRRLDHAMIFLLIVGTYTPVGLLVLQGTLATGGLLYSARAAVYALRRPTRHRPSTTTTRSSTC